MASENTETTTNTSTSQPTNPAVMATQSNLLGKLDAATNAGVPVNNVSLFAGAGDTTKNAWKSSLDAVSNPAYTSGVSGALDYTNNLIRSGGLTSGQQDLSRQYGELGQAYDGNTPGVSTLRNNLINDTTANVNTIFNNSGRFGGGTHVSGLGEGLGNALAGFDTNIYDKSVAARTGALNAQAGLQQQGVQNAFGAGAALPGYFSAMQLPGAAMGAVGSAQDADAQGRLLGENDRFQRVNGAPWDTLARSSSILNGTAGVGGQTTTSASTQPATPWWQSALGLGIGAAGAFL